MVVRRLSSVQNLDQHVLLLTHSFSLVLKILKDPVDSYRAVAMAVEEAKLEAL